MMARRKGRGLSLAEMVVAIGVLGLILVCLIGLITTGFAVQSKGEESINAVDLGQGELDGWKSRPYAEVAALRGLPPVVTAHRVGDRDYKCTTTVAAATNANPEGSVLCVSVRVDWTEPTALGESGTRQERPASLEITSLVSPVSCL